MPSFETQYEALTRGVGLVDISDRTQIEVSGNDRVTFLHNMCTQDVKKFAVGNGSETFLTDAKGHVLAYVDFFVTPNSIILETVRGQGDAITSHLDRYIIREDVRLTDKTEQWGQLLVAGEEAAAALAQLATDPLPERSWQHEANTIADRPTYLRRVLLAGPTSVQVCCAASDLPTVRSAFEAAGAVSCDRAVLETVRIENGIAFYGLDVTQDNLPQEVDRNHTAISFDKGCYIGQETVARLDALGHVNKLLVAIKFDRSEIPPPGTELVSNDKTVGKVTSSTFSPKFDAPLALAYVRSGHNAPGSRLASAYGDAEVVLLSQ